MTDCPICDKRRELSTMVKYQGEELYVCDQCADQKCDTCAHCGDLTYRKEINAGICTSCQPGLFNDLRSDAAWDRMKERKIKE